MSDKIFVKGMFVKKSTYGIKISVKTEEFEQFLKDNTNSKGYCNIELKTSREGEKMYAELDTWEPTPKEQKPEPGSDLPY